MINTLKPGDVHMSQWHYSDVIMGAIASQITSLTIVYSTVYSGADQINIKAPRHWALCGEFTGDKGPVTRKIFPFDEVLMSWVNIGLGNSLAPIRDQAMT